MGEHSRSNSQVLSHILGFGSICKACRSLLSKCYPEKNPSFLNKKRNKTKPISSVEGDHSKTSRYKNQKSIKRNSGNTMQEMQQDSRRHNIDHQQDSPPNGSPHWSDPPVSSGPGPTRLSRATSHGTSSSTFSRSASRKSQMAPAKGYILRTMSLQQRNSSDARLAGGGGHPRSSLSRSGSTQILYSNSSGLIKPAPMERQLDCTLEELCFGCVKKMTVTRDAVTNNGQIVEEDEVLTIKVKPGWRKGTKITFEGMGNEIPGANPGDVVFVVAEKDHPLFRRKDDDLELELEIPLVDALTGCTLSVPLLGDQKMSLTIDDIIQPGYEKVIDGQGMPKHNEPKTRGNLVIRFLVKFPEKLTEEQRYDAVTILRQIC